MLIRTLLAALNRAETPRTANAIAKLLEIRTGYRTGHLIDRLEAKGISISLSGGAMGSSESTEWLQRNGYNSIAAALGGGRNSFTGHIVTPDSALQASVIYACCKIISEDIATLPLFPFERSEDGSATARAYSHPSYRVVHDMPNPEMSAGEFREALTARACLGIDGYARIEKLQRGRFIMWPLLCGMGGDTTTVTKDRNANSQVFYVVKEGNAAEVPYPAAQIFHLRGFTFSGTQGDEILARARQILGLTLAGQEYAGRWYGQGAFPSVAITMPPEAGIQDENQVLKIKKAWNLWHQGLPAVGTPAVVQAGGKVELLSPDLQKQQALESRKYQVLEAARLYRMPLQKLLDLERMTFSNTEQMAIQYVQEVIGNWGRRWEEALERTILTEDERYWASGSPRMYFEHEYRKLLQGDFKAQTDGWRSMLEKGVFSINEVRKFLNLNPVEGGDGHYIQLNMQNVADAAQQILDQVAGEGGTPQQKNAIVEILERRMLPARPPESIQDAVNAALQPVIQAMTKPVTEPEPHPSQPMNITVEAPDIRITPQVTTGHRARRMKFQRDSSGRIVEAIEIFDGPRSLQ